jgi:hypothetical protein
MLVLDPKQRRTVQEILKHKWFTAEPNLVKAGFGERLEDGLGGICLNCPNRIVSNPFQMRIHKTKGSTALNQNRSRNATVLEPPKNSRYRPWRWCFSIIGSNSRRDITVPKASSSRPAVAGVSKCPTVVALNTHVHCPQLAAAKHQLIIDSPKLCYSSVGLN